MEMQNVQRPKKKLKAIDVMWILSIITIVGGWIYAPIILVALPCMFAPIFAGVFKNKTAVVCGSTCGRGSFLIKLWNKVSLKGKMPMFLNSKWFKLLATIALLSMFFRNVIINLILSDAAWADRIMNFSINMRVMINVTGLIALVVGFFFKPKTWCVFCPMGTVGKVLGSKIHKKR